MSPRGRTERYLPSRTGYSQVRVGTKISEFFAEKSEKNRFSVSLEKKKPWKTRLEEKSAKNRLYRRFFGEKSEISDFSVEKSDVCCKRWKARRRSEIAAIFRREIDFIADISAIYRPLFRKNPGHSDCLLLLIQRSRFVPRFFLNPTAIFFIQRLILNLKLDLTVQNDL